MSAIAQTHEQQAAPETNPHWLHWFGKRTDDQGASPLTLLGRGDDGRQAGEELGTGDPPALMLWGEES